MVRHDNAQRVYGNNTSHSYQPVYQDHLREGVGMKKGRWEEGREGWSERERDEEREREGRRGERGMEKERMEERIID